MATEHTWEGRYKVGIAGEKILDKLLFERLGAVSCGEAPYELQVLGIDRVIKFKTGYRIAAEYKTDMKASKTGNLYLETDSVLPCATSPGVDGWLKTSCAQVIYYYIPPRGIVAALEPSIWKCCQAKLGELRYAYTKNKNYSGRGIIWPIERLAEISSSVFPAPKFATERALCEFADNLGDSPGLILPG